MITYYADKEPQRTNKCTLTFHSTRRASQRGIKKDHIDLVMQHGKVIRKQGLRFFIMTQNELKYFPLHIQDVLKNMVVVLAGDENVVLTTYKNKDAVRNIKRKSKRLIKN